MAMKWGTNVSSDRIPNETFLSPSPQVERRYYTCRVQFLLITERQVGWTIQVRGDWKSFIYSWECHTGTAQSRDESNTFANAYHRKVQSNHQDSTFSFQDSCHLRTIISFRSKTLEIRPLTCMSETCYQQRCCLEYTNSARGNISTQWTQQWKKTLYKFET
jgi:hypothetical protein